MIRQTLHIPEMLVAPLAVMVLRALNPVLLQGVPRTGVEVTFVAVVVGHEGKERLTRLDLNYALFISDESESGVRLRFERLAVIWPLRSFAM